MKEFLALRSFFILQKVDILPNMFVNTLFTFFIILLHS